MQNSYLDDVIVSRRLMNNMINLMSHQERNIRAIYVTERNNRNNSNNQYSYFVNGTDMNTAPRNNIGPISQPNNTRPQTTTRRQRGVGSQNVVATQHGGIQPPRDPVFHFNNLFTPTRGISRPRRPTIPSPLEINTATISNTFSNIERPQNTTCPITRESFNANDNVTQIIQCGHTFNTNNLYEWFDHSSVCPMCRYDIRSNSDATTAATAATAATTATAATATNNEVDESNMTDLTNIAEQIANDILSNIAEAPSISLEYSLYTPTVNNSTTTHRTSIDPSLNV